ncbi:MAG: carbon starvation protein A [Planctomycetes bacterium]|nr:carbon starvation protein A [Planctomycetota bacterium]
MTLSLLALGFLALVSLGYRLYGGFVARKLALDDRRATPAVELEDGRDFVPTPRFYLFGQHFSAIAAAGPIAGPILAAQNFGWLPCLLWIGLGVVFIGAVHDFATLVASVRHRGHSIADIAREHLGPRAGYALTLFLWIALIYVIVAFVDITAGTFVTGGEDLAGARGEFNRGGAVAAASTGYLVLALLLGLLRRFTRLPLALLTLLFVPAILAMSWLGTEISTLLLFSRETWALLILGYCFLASLSPVWLLLQPRGYLGGFVLYAALLLGVLGVFCGGYAIQQPAFKTWDLGTATGQLFPFLFVTIACGACSGFHGLVCSGTTSKQVAKESHTLSVGYGAMLAEGCVAFLALVTVMIFTNEELRGLSPGAVYGQGIGRFLELLLGEGQRAFAITFGAMVFSTFVFDTIDVCTRLGRYLLQEILGWRSTLGAVLATFVTVAVPGLFLSLGGSGGYLRFWSLFGASNQLLAALTFLSILVWLRTRGTSALFVWLPLAFLLPMTTWALLKIALASFAAAQGFDLQAVNGLAASLLLLLALVLLAASWQRLRSIPRPPVATSTADRALHEL